MASFVLEPEPGGPITPGSASGSDSKALWDPALDHILDLLTPYERLRSLRSQSGVSCVSLSPGRQPKGTEL